MWYCLNGWCTRSRPGPMSVCDHQLKEKESGEKCEHIEPVAANIAALNRVQLFNIKKTYKYRSQHIEAVKGKGKRGQTAPRQLLDSS